MIVTTDQTLVLLLYLISLTTVPDTNSEGSVLMLESQYQVHVFRDSNSLGGGGGGDYHLVVPDMNILNTLYCRTNITSQTIYPTDDETNDESKDVNEEEYDRIDKELYGDVNIRLTDAEQYDEELEVVSMMVINVQHESPHTSPLLTVPISVIPEHTIFNPSETVTTSSSTTISSLLSLLFHFLQQSTPIPTLTKTKAKTSTTVVPDFETLNALHQRMANLEKDVKELKDVDNSTKVISKIKSEVLNSVKEYLYPVLDDALHKVIQRNICKHQLGITLFPDEIIEKT
ncbi:hypothetical protein Tco_0834329 [Tanacetum coccineum]